MPLTPAFNEQSFLENHLQFAGELGEAVTEADTLVKSMEPFLERFLSPVAEKWTVVDVKVYFDHITYKTERCLSHLSLHRSMIEDYEIQLQKLDSQGKLSGDAFNLLASNNRACLKQVEDHARELEEMHNDLTANLVGRFPSIKDMPAARSLVEKFTTDPALSKKFRL